MAETPAPALVPLVERVALHLRPGRPLRPTPVVAFYPYVDTKCTVRDREGRLHLRLSDHLMDAPDAVLEGVVGYLLCRLWGLDERRMDPHALAAYRAHVGQERMHRRMEASRTTRGSKRLDPVGDHRSLLESYLRVTLDLGVRPPRTPRLGWSPTASRRRFGHWDAAHGCIVISRVLDDDRVPEWVLDYVVYHEVLHVVHPVEHTEGRRRIHTPAFRRDERRYPRWQAAEAWLEHLAAGRSPRRGPRLPRPAGPHGAAPGNTGGRLPA